MRIGIRLAVSILVLTFIIVSAAGVHFLWWRTAEASSQTLASTIDEQIVSSVGDELQSITTEAKSAFTAVRTLLVRHVLDIRESNKLEFVFLSQLQSQPTISWVVLGRPDGAFLGAHKLGDSAIEIIGVTAGQTKQSIERYEAIDGDFQFKDKIMRDGADLVKDREWFRDAIESEGPQFSVTTRPGDERLAAVLAGPIDVDGKRHGVLAIMIELSRVSRYLSQLTTGKSAGAFILDRDGRVVAAPDANADEVTEVNSNHALLPIAVSALRNSSGKYDADGGRPFRSRIEQGKDAYEVVLNPLSLPGWSLATVVPESEFLGPVRKTIQELVVGLAMLIAVAGLLSAWLAQRTIAAPLIKVVSEVKHVERFELDEVKRHRSRLAELDNLSGAIADMAGGLSAFRKYIPADLVRTLAKEGVDAKPGGSIRPMTALFADVAGFTGLSERLGDKIIPLLSRYLDVMSAEISLHHGTIDKFIGDAVMAFWGAPASNPDHAAEACRAALASQRAMKMSSIVDDNGQPLRIRIGINSGDMLVGNIGSAVRLNYTVIGDAVNIASRLEGANKSYNTEIIIGEETYRLASAQIHARELDILAVYGRAGSIKVYELVGLVGEEHAPTWLIAYAEGLAYYRARNFKVAIECFERVLSMRKLDPPSEIMIRRCHDFIASPPPEDWQGTAVAESK
ncbi:MAG: adenylate/guanylate cyclase domain-containing protein [Rhizobiales bacterium]|nr:adenylate/guanylate cyclase domain-containing protein [Hyphomicrobiales bacterium]